MTETASHVAIKTIDHQEDETYHAVSGVNFSKTSDDRLIINSPDLGVIKMETNDVVRLNGPHSFVWIGRSDHVVNSGGYKLHPEILSKNWNQLTSTPFFLCGEADARLGEKLVIYFEGEKEEKFVKSVINSLFTVYEVPKTFYLVKEFTRSDSGKVLQLETTKLDKKEFEALL